MSNARDVWAEKLAEQARILGEARVLRDEQPITEALRAAVLKRLREFLKRVERGAEWAARSMGLEGPILEAILDGRGPADDEAIVRTIDKWIEQQILRENAPKPAGFVKTRVVDQIYGVAAWMCRINGIGLIVGPAGIGKSIALAAIRAETPGSVMLSIRTTGLSRLAVMNQIADALKITGVVCNAGQIFNAIERVMRDTGRLLIVDEVHKLASRLKDEALHSLRDLHDATGCPMLWAGAPNIHTYLMEGRVKHEPLDQIASRIKYVLDLAAVAQQTDGGPGLYTIEDIQRWINAQKIRVTSDGIRFLMLLANTWSAGGLRTCDGLIRVADHLARGQAISAEMLRSILAQQRGGGIVEMVDRQIKESTPERARLTAG